MASGDLLEALLPLSARQALRAQRAGSGDDGGLGAVRAALEERFFSRARALKRATALSALQRFAAEAGALVRAALPPAAVPGPPVSLEASAQALAGVVAAERLRLPARIDASLRQAAAEVAELMEPRVWPFGDRRSGPADRQFLLDLLDDAVFEATAVTARELAAALEGGPALDIAGFIERFRAYARGVWRGGLADDILREQAGGRPGTAADLAQMQRVMAGRAPDVEGELLRPLEAAAAAAQAEARAAHAASQTRAELQRLILEERLVRPIAALDVAVAGLAAGESD